MESDREKRKNKEMTRKSNDGKTAVLGARTVTFTGNPTSLFRALCVSLSSRRLPVGTFSVQLCFPLLFA